MTIENANIWGMNLHRHCEVPTVIAVVKIRFLVELLRTEFH